jgi:sodium-dependent dicarboxylate transporter 2/3/5
MSNAPRRHPLHDASTKVGEAIRHPARYGLRQWSGWLIGPLCLFITVFIEPPSGLSVEGWRTAGAACLMATFWITEAIPIPATALLPLVLFPALHLGDIKSAAEPYANPLIFLFLGGFIIALAMQKWDLHRRIAIGLISRIGTRPRQIIAGFLVAAAFLSMWVSNTATALMLLPIAMSVVQLARSEGGGAEIPKPFGSALILSVAYGATTGGMGTLIGTPPNALLAGFIADLYKINIGFGQWMLLGVPVVVLALPVVYLVLTRVAFRLENAEIPGMSGLIAAERTRLGPMRRGELAVAVVFASTALCWVLQPLIAAKFPLVSDTTIAIAGALLLFMIPVNTRRGEFVMDWESAKGIPWDVLILFGGGLSLAGCIQKHGLSAYLGHLCGGLSGLPVILTLGVICFGILLLTELTSNTATTATFLPVTAAIAVSIGQNPLLFLIPTALAANCSFMLPVGTPPNAIVFGSGLVTLPQMARAGLLLNLLFVPLLVGVLWLLGPLVFGIEFGILPTWAK